VWHSLVDPAGIKIDQDRRYPADLTAVCNGKLSLIVPIASRAPNVLRPPKAIAGLAGQCP